MKAGSITFSTALDNEQLEKDLSSLTKKIEKKERESADLAVQRDEAKGKGAFDAAVLDAEKAKLQEIKDRLADIRARAKDKTLSLEKRDAAKELIPSVKQEYDDQRVRVRGLQTEWNKTEAAVERYGAQLSKAEDELSRQKSEAGYIVRKLDEAKKSASRMAAEAGIADQRIINLNRELSELNARQKELESAGIGYGYEEYDQNAARIAEINRELKEYKKSLTEVAAAEQAAGQARQQAGQTAGSQSRINTYLEKTSSLYQKLNGMIGKTTKMSGVLREAATSSTGQIGSAITSILGILETVPGIVGAIAGKIGAIIATALPEIRVIAYIIVIVIELIKKLGDLISQKMQAIKDDIVKTAEAFIVFGKLAAKGISAAAKGTAKFVSSIIKAVSGLNVFSKLSDSLSQKLKQLGSVIKQALVFSVIYQGLSMVRQQIGSYLVVNAQFTTALRRLQGALLTAFQPIYEVVVPALTALINILSRAIATVTQFFASLFGKTAKQAQSNAENLYDQANATQAAGDAAEEASKQLAAFDKINKLDGKNSAGGGGSAGAETGPLFDFEYEDTPFDSWGEAFSAFLDKLLGGIPKLRDAFKSFADWLNDLTENLYEMFTFPGVLEKVKQLGRELADALNYLTDLIEWEQLGRALGAGLNLALNFLTSFIYEYDWMNLGHRLAEMVNGLVDEIDWKEFGRLLWAGFKIGLETLAGFLLGLDMPLMAQAASDIVIGFFDEMTNTIRRIPWGDIGRQIADFLVNLDWRGMLSSVTSAIAAGIMAAVAGIRGFLDRIVPELDRIAGEIVQTLIEFFRDKVKWDELARTIGDGIAAALQFISDLFDPELFYEIGKAIGDFFINLQWVEIFGGLTEALANGINSAIAALRGFLDSVTPEKLKAVADGIAQKINEFVDKVEWAELGQTISDGIEAALDFMIELMDKIEWDAVGAAIVEFLENIDWDTLLSKWGTLMGQFIDAKLRAVDLSGALDVGMEIVAGLAKGMWNKFLESGGVLGWLKSLLVDPIINGVKSLLGIHSPSTVFAELGGFLIAGLAQGISDTWHTITVFFSEKISSLKQVLMDAWENIKSTASSKWSEIKAALGAKWDEIKSSASETFEKVRQKIVDAWNNVKNDAIEKWDEIKAGIADAWEKVKTAAGEKFGEIKDKIINTMDEVKDKDWFKTGKTIVDGILSGLESIWNSLTSWARSVKDTISDALSGASGSRGGGFGTGTRGGGGFNARIAAASIPDITAFNIPALAAGAVIPPNREFLAVLGDQRSGNNIETPEGLLRDIFRQENGAILAVLREILSAIRQGKEMTVDGNTFAKLVYNGYNSESNRKGVNLVEVHA